MDNQIYVQILLSLNVLMEEHKTSLMELLLSGGYVDASSGEEGSSAARKVKIPTGISPATQVPLRESVLYLMV